MTYVNYMLMSAGVCLFPLPVGFSLSQPSPPRRTPTTPTPPTGQAGTNISLYVYCIIYIKHAVSVLLYACCLPSTLFSMFSG